ncbi:MAG: [citrate (pro-3S)-lyase] ligase [Petroclostridium sp.]|uniref:[citrate (pro-3S)-lyase] ligase n=1 Tax=Petroclostridium xylanilyticum TaxID=1792311 RepID=UPI000B98D9C9|nr:[citrate (pro-3S)-lyase] ligase [Petroclostridium xylanilyticum]MDK2809961.1 [citrate (pro-3S)-lyase] ligase [Petroclostridium sp.]
MEFDNFAEQIINLNSIHEKSLVENFLNEQNLLMDKDIEYCVALLDKGRIIGTGSFSGRVLKCIAVDPEYQNRGLSNKIVSHLINEQYRRLRTHLFVYTKPENIKTFTELGFYKIAEVPSKVVLMENRLNGLKNYLNEISAHKAQGGVVSSIVVNCNPFTLGHQYLIEYAASMSDQLNIFVVWEDRSSFPANVRYRLVKEGVSHLSNVAVHMGKDYIISDATFPSYFIKEYSDIVETHAILDLTIFGDYIAPALNITKRFVGEEPYCAVTRTYNSIMKKLLPEKNIEVIEVPRLAVGDKAVSASRVRELIKNGELDAIKQLVPKTTYNYLISEEGQQIVKRIQQSQNKRH